MTINACVPRQDKENIPTMQAEQVQDIQHAGCDPTGTSIHQVELRIVTETSVSPMTITVCVPVRNDSINMLQDNPYNPDILPNPEKIPNTRVKDASKPFRTLTGVVMSKKRINLKSPSNYHLGEREC